MWVGSGGAVVAAGLLGGVAVQPQWAASQVSYAHALASMPGWRIGCRAGECWRPEQDYDLAEVEALVLNQQPVPPPF